MDEKVSVDTTAWVADTDGKVSADKQPGPSDISPLPRGIQASVVDNHAKVSVVDNQAMESADNHVKALVVDNHAKVLVADNQAMESVDNHAKASVVDIHAKLSA